MATAYLFPQCTPHSVDHEKNVSQDTVFTYFYTIFLLKQFESNMSTDMNEPDPHADLISKFTLASGPAGPNRFRVATLQPAQYFFDGMKYCIYEPH